MLGYQKWLFIQTLAHELEFRRVPTFLHAAGKGKFLIQNHCLGWTILTRRQNVAAGGLNFAKSHFAVPNSGCVTLAKF